MAETITERTVGGDTSENRDELVSQTDLILSDISHEADDGVSLVNQPGEDARGV